MRPSVVFWVMDIFDFLVKMARSSAGLKTVGGINCFKKSKHKVE